MGEGRRKMKNSKLILSLAACPHSPLLPNHLWLHIHLVATSSFHFSLSLSLMNTWLGLLSSRRLGLRSNMLTKRLRTVDRVMGDGMGQCRRSDP